MSFFYNFLGYTMRAFLTLEASVDIAMCAVEFDRTQMRMSEVPALSLSSIQHLLTLEASVVSVWTLQLG